MDDLEIENFEEKEMTFSHLRPFIVKRPVIVLSHLDRNDKYFP